MAEKGIKCVYVRACVNMCEYASKVVIISVVIIRAVMESHTFVNSQFTSRLCSQVPSCMHVFGKERHLVKELPRH